MKFILKPFIICTLLFFANTSFAETTYQLQVPSSGNTVHFPHTGSGVTGAPLYDFMYKIPTGTQFDRIQIAVPDAQGLIGKNEYVVIQSNPGSCEWFFNDIDNNSWASCLTLDSTLTITSESKPSAGAYQFIFSTTTTITNDNQFFRMILDPNSPYVDFSYLSTVFPTGASANGYNYVKTNAVPTMKFCNGVCDSNDFEYIAPTQNVYRDSYETRFTGVSFSYSSTTQDLTVNSGYFIDLEEVNEEIPSLNPAMVRLRWSETNFALPATNQFAVADNIPLVQGYATTTQTASDLPDGFYLFEVSFTNLSYQISQDSEKKPFPRTYMIFEIEIAGGAIVQQNVDTVYTGQLPEFETTANCSLTDISGCLIKAFSFLIIPGEFSTNAIKTEFDTLLTKKPFSYFSQVTDVVQTAAETTASSTFVNLEITVPIIGTSLPIITKDSLDAIYPTDTRLLIKNAIANGLWILFALSLIFMLLNIFNKASYTAQEPEYTVTKHESHKRR